MNELLTPCNISIIVPVYNAEKYLRQCIDSILNQSFKDFELLLVDDGSTDGSGKLCDEYARKVQSPINNQQSPIIKVIHQDNKGSSAARQVGFENAQGKYIVAVDADDWVDVNYLEDMLRIMETEKADVVMSAYWFSREGHDTYIANKPSTNEVVVWQKDFLNFRCHAGLWNKMFRNEILQSGKVIIPKYSYFEDMTISISYLEQCTKLNYNASASYHYRYNDTSLTNAQNIEKRILRLQEMLENMVDLYHSLSKEKRTVLKTDIESCVNNQKWEVLDVYPKTYTQYKALYKLFAPLKSPYRRITNLTSLCYYLLSKGMTMPFRLMNIYRAFKTANRKR